MAFDNGNCNSLSISRVRRRAPALSLLVGGACLDEIQNPLLNFHRPVPPAGISVKSEFAMSIARVLRVRES